MEIKRYVSLEPKTPYAPTWDFYIGKCNLNINLSNLAKTCLEMEEKILDLPIIKFKDENGEEYFFDGYTGLGKDSTTARSWLYNLFDWNTPETNSLKEQFKSKLDEYNTLLSNPIPKVYYSQCWYNVLRTGQKINPHLHSTNESSYLSAHFTVQCNDTSTVYINPVNQLNDPQIIEEKNKPGNLTIFPMYVPHYTTEHLSDTPRITIAMDVRFFEPDNDGGEWVEL